MNGLRTIAAAAFFVCLLALAGCRGASEKAGPVQAANTLYFDYQITGEEGEDSVACRLQCRRGGPEGETVLLPQSSVVSFDGEQISPDSAGFSGIYYEIQKPAAAFSGEHTWTIKDERGKTTRAQFSYTAFSLQELPPQIKRGDLVLGLKNLPNPNARLHLLLVDTAWASNDFNSLIRAHDSRLFIPIENLRELKAGPISLELRYDESLPLQPDVQSGLLHLSYGLRRSFDLID